MLTTHALGCVFVTFPIACVRACGVCGLPLTACVHEGAVVHADESESVVWPRRSCGGDVFHAGDAHFPQSAAGTVPSLVCLLVGLIVHPSLPCPLLGLACFSRLSD